MGLYCWWGKDSAGKLFELVCLFLGRDFDDLQIVTGESFESVRCYPHRVFQVHGAPADLRKRHVDVQDHAFFEQCVRRRALLTANCFRIVGVFEPQSMRCRVHELRQARGPHSGDHRFG